MIHLVAHLSFDQEPRDAQNLLVLSDFLADSTAASLHARHLVIRMSLTPF